MLERSGTVPLFIEVHERGPIQNVLQVLHTQLHRLRALKIDNLLELPALTQVCNMITESGTTSLTDLSLNLAVDEEEAETGPVLFDHLLPDLRPLQCLRIYGLSISPSWAGFSSTLTELDIALGTDSADDLEHLSRHRGYISTITMLSMLERCQSLQTLKLHYVLDGSDPFDDDERNADIYLPSLQSLHLADHHERLGWLFCHLRYPSRTIVRVEVVVGMMDPTVGEYLGERLLNQLGYDSAVQAVHLQVTDWETERPALTLSCWPSASLPQPWKPFRRIGRELDLIRRQAVRLLRAPSIPARTYHAVRVVGAHAHALIPGSFQHRSTRQCGIPWSGQLLL